MPTSEEAAAAAAAQALGTEDQETESGSETETTDEVEWPTFEIDLPAELRAELEEPEVEDTTDEEVAALSEQYEDVDEDLLKRLAAAEKKAAHFEKLRTEEAKKGWKAEAEKFFPLAEPFLDEIQATSRRGFLRTAKNVHERMLPIVEERVLKPAKEAIEKTKQETVAETKDEIKKAWGEPVDKDAEHQPPPAAEAGQQRRRRGELSDVIRSMIFNKE